MNSSAEGQAKELKAMSGEELLEIENRFINHYSLLPAAEADVGALLRELRRLQPQGRCEYLFRGVLEGVRCEKANGHTGDHGIAAEAHSSSELECNVCGHPFHAGPCNACAKVRNACVPKSSSAGPSEPRCPTHNTPLERREREDDFGRKQVYWNCQHEGCHLFISDFLIQSVMQFFPASQQVPQSRQFSICNQCEQRQVCSEQGFCYRPSAASQQVDVRELAAEVDALYSAEVAGDLWPTLDEVVAVLSESIGVDQSARIRELEQQLASMEDSLNFVTESRDIENTRAEKAESELAALKDAAEDVVNARSLRDKGQMNQDNVDAFVDSLLAALSATPAEPSQGELLRHLTKPSPNCTSEPEDYSTDEAGQTNVPQIKDGRWPRWWSACSSNSCEWCCTGKRGGSEQDAENDLHKHIEACHPEGGSGNVYQVGILARGPQMGVAEQREHKWKGYENSAGYGTICENCHKTVAYPNKLPTTSCPGPAAPAQPANQEEENG